MTAIPDVGQPPTEASVLAELGTVIGEEIAKALWENACRSRQLNRPVTRSEDLIAVSDTLMELANLLRVSARSSKVRLVTYRALGAATSR